MSYILDALRRAEAEREQGAVPGLHAQAAGPVADPRGRPTGGQARWVAPTLVALVIAVAVLALRPWTADKPVGAPAGVGPAALPGPASVDAPSVSTAPVATPPAAVEPAAPMTSQGVTAPSLAEAPGRRSPVAAPAAAPVLAAASKKRSSAVVPADTPASAGAAESKVYAQADLPPEIRQQLPALAIGGSIYSASPSSRFVIVNGQLLHEGDTVAPGLVLQEIRLKSAVLAFRGYRYGITF